MSPPSCDENQHHEGLSITTSSQNEISNSSNTSACGEEGDSDDLSLPIPHLYPTTSVSLPTLNMQNLRHCDTGGFQSWHRVLYLVALSFLFYFFAFKFTPLQPYIHSKYKYFQSEQHPSISLRKESKIDSTKHYPEERSLFKWFHRTFRERSRVLKSDFSPSPPTRTGGSKNSKLVVAGKLTINGADCSIAQLDLDTGFWNNSECVQLNLYNSFSGGDVNFLLANHSTMNADSSDGSSTSTGVKSTSKIKDTDTGGQELIVVGAFDTTYKNSQLAYCSVGKWNGEKLSKIGEGLCNSALSKGMKITTAAMANKNDVFVAGSFVTQVWNGAEHQFVKIYNLAHFNALEQVWLPLNVGQITCSWCTVTVLALAFDSHREQLHIAGKFNAIDGRNIPAGLAVYNRKTGHLVAHPGGGLSLLNITEDGVATALQIDEDSGVLYVMGTFDRLTDTKEICHGLAAYEIVERRWTCLADPTHSVVPSGGGNMLLTPYGLMVAGRTTETSTWEHPERPYTIALLSTRVTSSPSEEETEAPYTTREFNWTWLPGYPGHYLPLHSLTNGYDDYRGTVFIGGDNYLAKWSYEEAPSKKDDSKNSPSKPNVIPVTHDLSGGAAKGMITAMSQLVPAPKYVPSPPGPSLVGYTIVIYFMALGSVIGVFLALMCNKSLNTAMMKFVNTENSAVNRGIISRGISLDTLTYSAIENSNIQEAYHRAMETRFVHRPRLLTLIDPHEIYLHRIIGEGTFGRVWSAKWKSSSVAVKEFVFAQAAVAGRSSMQKEIIDEIIGEAGMMAILRHPYVLQLFGCSLTAQAIWIVSELCSLGSLRQLLDDSDQELKIELRLQMALHVAEGMTYLHNQNPPIIHRDLKSHNIFVHETYTDTLKPRNKNKGFRRKKYNDRFDEGKRKRKDRGAPILSEATVVAKIGDWGSARAALSGSRTMTHGVGTACWLAPEVIKNARASKFSDVYSFGIVLWELATREEVYPGLETTQIIARVAGDQLRPEVPESCIWKDIMVQCWDEIPQNRLTFETIVIELNKILTECKKGSGSDLASIMENSENQENYYEGSYQKQKSREAS